jgi:hypothetical protein
MTKFLFPVVVLTGFVVFVYGQEEPHKLVTPAKTQVTPNGFELQYTLNKKVFGGKMPDMVYVTFWGPQPVKLEVVIAGKKQNISPANKAMIDNLYNHEITIVATFEENIGEFPAWSNLTLKVTPKNLSLESKNNNRFMREVMEIPNVRGASGGVGPNVVHKVFFPRGFLKTPAAKAAREAVNAVATKNNIPKVLVEEEPLQENEIS